MDFDDLDLSAKAAEGATMELRHPITFEVLKGDDGKPLTITLLGADSPTFKRASVKILETAQRKKNMSTAEQERAVVNALADATTGWSDNWTWGGEPFKFSPENCRKLYTERSWARSQVDEFMSDRSNFFETA